MSASSKIKYSSTVKSCINNLIGQRELRACSGVKELVSNTHVSGICDYDGSDAKIIVDANANIIATGTYGNELWRISAPVNYPTATGYTYYRLRYSTDNRLYVGKWVVSLFSNKFTVLYSLGNNTTSSASYMYRLGQVYGWQLSNGAGVVNNKTSTTFISY